MSWGFRDQSKCAVSSVPNSMEFTAPNFSKESLILIPTGPIEFPQKTKIIRTVQKGCMWFAYTTSTNSLIGSLEFFPWGNITRHVC